MILMGPFQLRIFRDSVNRPRPLSRGYAAVMTNLREASLLAPTPLPEGSELQLPACSTARPPLRLAASPRPARVTARGRRRRPPCAGAAEPHGGGGVGAAPAGGARGGLAPRLQHRGARQGRRDRRAGEGGPGGRRRRGAGSARGRQRAGGAGEVSRAVPPEVALGTLSAGPVTRP